MRKILPVFLCACICLSALFTSCWGFYVSDSKSQSITSASYCDKNHFYVSGKNLDSDSIATWLWTCKNVDMELLLHEDKARDFKIVSIETSTFNSPNVTFKIRVEPDFTPGDEIYLYSKRFEGTATFTVPEN